VRPAPRPLILSQLLPSIPPLFSLPTIPVPRAAQ
jgi:hypothetical protein